MWNQILFFLDAACSDLVTEFVLEDFDEEEEPDQVGEVDHPAKQNEAFHRSDSEPVIIKCFFSILKRLGYHHILPVN